ncbi:UNVERIFIED_ORG: hypothetical protein E4P37_11500 [Bacillus sp. AZ43]
MSTEEALRERLRALATRAGIPVPPLEVDDDRKLDLPPADVDRKGGARRIVVAAALLHAPPAEQDWHLATALGWWASPEPQRRRRRGWLVCSAIALPHLAVGGVALVDDGAIPLWVAVIAGPVLGFVLVPVRSALARHERRAFDAAGDTVLAASGRDPAALARAVLGRRPDPSWYRRPFANEPPPSRRIADAEQRRSRPAPSLY